MFTIYRSLFNSELSSYMCQHTIRTQLSLFRGFRSRQQRCNLHTYYFIVYIDTDMNCYFFYVIKTKVYIAKHTWSRPVSYKFHTKDLELLNLIHISWIFNEVKLLFFFLRSRSSIWKKPTYFCSLKYAHFQRCIFHGFKVYRGIFLKIKRWTFLF